MWTKSACVVLAWSILLIFVVAVGMKGSAHPVQANIRIASSTTEVTSADAPSVAAAFAAASLPARYVVQPGDTLSGIAARFAVRGGWPALYAANRPLIGPDPNVIHPGTVLVLPGPPGLVRYTVVAGDTLSGIAAALAVRGGWPALYAANRRVIGRDPNAIHPGTVLTVPDPAAPSRPASSPGHRPNPPPPTSRPRIQPGTTRASVTAGMPYWLKFMLPLGLLIVVALLMQPELAARRRRQAAARAAQHRTADTGQEPDAGWREAKKTRIVLADYDRVIVTLSKQDDTIYVLRPPEQDPQAILQVARLVLPEGRYRELAGELDIPASWPIILADYDRLVVTHSKRDDTAYVLRPPGQDPRAILRAARLVLPEGSYAELADQLDIPASWPME